MRCVICRSLDIEEREVEETIRVNNDVIVLPIRTLVCLNCGERYYDRKTMQRLEQMERDVRDRKISLEAVGTVLKPSISA